MKRKIIKGDVNKFSFAQMTSNSDGKTSGSGTMGVFICFIGSLAFLGGVIGSLLSDKTPDIMMQAIIFTGIGAGLLGYRKSRDNSEEYYSQEPYTEEPAEGPRTCHCENPDCPCKQSEQ
jgi:hypothetical protein